MPRAGRRGDAGYSVLEAVIVLPVIVTLTMLVIQYALVWHGRHVAESAAQDGVRAARTYQGTPEAGEVAALRYLRQVAPRLLSRPAATVSSTPASVTVRVRADVQSLLTFGRFTVTESASAPREVFVSGEGG